MRDGTVVKRGWVNMGFNNEVEMDGLTKKFGALCAVDGVTLSARRGQVLGLLGHNGAGKTTLMRLMAGLLTPDVGTVSVLGLNPLSHGKSVRSRLGVLPSTDIVDGRLTAMENLEFAASVRGIDRVTTLKRAEGLLERFKLDGREGERAASFSAGMKQRLALSAVMISEPEILLLDEPTSAMDPVGARDLLLLLRELCSSKDRTVVIATHDLGVASELCDQLVILSEGRVILRGEPDLLTQDLGGRTIIRVGPGGQAEAGAKIVRSFDASAAVSGDRSVEACGLTEAVVPAVVRRLVEGGIDVHGVRDEAATLEDLYFQLHEGSAARARTAGASVSGVREQQVHS